MRIAYAQEVYIVCSVIHREHDAGKVDALVIARVLVIVADIEEILVAARV